MFFFLTCRNRSVLSSVGNPLFGVRQPCCRFSFSATPLRCKQPKPRLLESTTYEMQISQVLCFDIHTKCGGCGGGWPRLGLQSPVTNHNHFFSIGCSVAFTRNGSLNSVKSPGPLPATGKSRAESGLCHFTARLATSPMMRESCSAVMSPGSGMVSRPVPHTAE